jgi:hypothetical protein
MTAQGIDINVFDGLSMSGMFPVHATAALGAAEMHPVGRFVAGSTKTSTLDQGFDQKGTITVQPLPVIRQMAGGKRQNLTCQPANGYEGRDEETAIGNDELKTSLSLFSTPADPGIAWGHRPCGAGKLQTCQIPARQSFGFHEIAQACAKRDAVAKVMPAFDKLFESRIKLPVGGLDELQRQGLELSCAAGNGRLWVAVSGKQNLSRPGSGSGSKLGKRNRSVALKQFEQRPAFFVFQFPVWAFPFEEFTQGFGQFGKAQIRKGPHGLSNETDIVRRKGPAGSFHMLLNHGRNLHCLSYRSRLEKVCPAKNEVRVENSSVAGSLDPAEKWVEAELLENANSWKIDRKSS